MGVRITQNLGSSKAEEFIPELLWQRNGGGGGSGFLKPHAGFRLPVRFTQEAQNPVRVSLTLFRSFSFLGATGRRGPSRPLFRPLHFSVATLFAISLSQQNSAPPRCRG